MIAKFKLPCQTLLLLSLCLLLCACQESNCDVIPENSIMDSEKEQLIWSGELRDDSWFCEGVCIGSDGMSCDGFRVRILTEEGTIFQEVPLSAESRIMPTGTAHWEDVNFDGELDILVHLGGDRGGAQGYAAVLWDETLQTYREEPVYAEIRNPAPDSEHRIVWDGTDSSFQFDLSAWEYIDGALTKTHRLSVFYDASSVNPAISFTEYALESGTLTEIQQMTMQTDHADIDAYISADAVWDGWKWCDMQRFQQKG